MLAQREYRDLFQLVRDGYLYDRTAPKYRNGRGYFYLVSSDGRHKKSCVYEMTPEEFKKTKRQVEYEMTMLYGKKYYTPQKKKKYTSEYTYDESIIRPKLIVNVVNNAARRMTERIVGNMTLNMVIMELGWILFPWAIKYSNLPMENLDDFFNDPQRFAHRLGENLLNMLRSAQNPEYVRELERKNQELRMEMENYKNENEALKAINEELRIQLSALSGMVEPQYIDKFVAWNNFRYIMGWTPVRNLREYDRMVNAIPYTSYVAMPDLTEYYWWKNFRNTAATIYMLNRLGRTTSDKTLLIDRLTDLKIKLATRDLNEKIDNLTREQALLSSQIKTLSAKQDSTPRYTAPPPKPVPSPKPSPAPQPQLDEERTIELLKKRGYSVEPPPSRDDLEKLRAELITQFREEINSQMKEPEKADSSMIEMLNYLREEKVLDKILNFILFYYGKISKEDYFKIAGYTVSIGTAS